jgi:hypothetical protein
MTDMERTLKLAQECDEEIHFERKVKRDLLRLHDLLGKANALARIRATRIEELEAQLYAVGAGGVGTQMKSAGSNHVEQRLDMVPPGWKLVPVVPTDAMLDLVRKNGGHQAAALAWASWGDMLAAAPQPPKDEPAPGEIR